MENVLKLFNYATLKDLNVINNPVELGFSSMNVFIAQVLIKNPSLSRFCKVEITEAHKLEAVYLAQHKHNVAEEERKRLEEEEKAKAAAEEAEG